MDKITADAAILHKDYVMAPEEVASFIKEHGVTAQAISRMGIDLETGKVNLGLLTPGFDALTEQEIVLPPYNGSDFIYCLQNPGGFIPVEGTLGILWLPGIERFVQAIASVPDAVSGKPATDVYAPIPRTDTRLVQYNFVPREPAQVLNPIGKMGIVSIRYIVMRCGFLLAVLVDDRGESKGLITLSLSVAQNDPTKIVNHLIWKMHGQMTRRNIVTLGRPKATVDGDIAIAAHLQGGYEVLITIQKHGNEFRFIWGEEIRTTRVAIGIVNGTDMFASYRPRTDFAELVFEPKEGADRPRLHG